jgi:hypothetical protein
LKSANALIYCLAAAAQRFGIKVIFTYAAATITTPASSTPVGAAPMP